MSSGIDNRVFDYLRQGIVGHYLVIYLEGDVQLEPKQQLALQKSEVQAGCWLSPSELDLVVEAVDKTKDQELVVQLVSGKSGTVSAQSMQGIYPNSINKGTAQGHLFILETLSKRLTTSKF